MSHSLSSSERWIQGIGLGPMMPDYLFFSKEPRIPDFSKEASDLKRIKMLLKFE